MNISFVELLVRSGMFSINDGSLRFAWSPYWNEQREMCKIEQRYWWNGFRFSKFTASIFDHEYYQSKAVVTGSNFQYKKYIEQLK